MGDVVLATGDVLLVRGPATQIAALQRDDQVLVLDAAADLPHTHESPTAVAIMSGVILVSALGLLWIEPKAVGGLRFAHECGRISWRTRCDAALGTWPRNGATTMTSGAAEAGTDDVVDAYWRDGAVYLREAFEPCWIEALTAGIEAVRATSAGEYHWYVGGPGQERVFFNATRMWPRIDAFRRFVHESGIADLAGQISRSTKLNLLWDGVFYRTEGLEQPTPWHQDAPYWPVEGERIVSVWIPVDAVSAESVLGFVRGSHRMGRFQRRSFRDGGRTAHFVAGDSDAARPLPDIDAGVPGFEVVRAAMRPGDCLVFHGLTLHGSPGNRARASKLRAVSFRFAGDGTTFVHRPEGTSPSFPAEVQRAGEAVGGALFPQVWCAGA